MKVGSTNHAQIMKAEAALCILAIILACGESRVTIFSREDGTRLCPGGNKCTCSSGSGGAYEVVCYGEVTPAKIKEEMYEVSPNQVMLEIQPGNYARIQCSHLTEWRDLSLLAGLHVGNCPTVKFQNCPLPVISNSFVNESSFKDLFNSIGIQNVTSLIFQSYLNLTKTLKAKHLERLSGVTKLILSNNGLTNLPEDLFSCVPDVTWIDLRDNSINVPPSLFQGLPKLVVLEMGSNALTNLPPDIFHGLSRLRLLNLWKNKLGESNLSRLHFSDMSALESLDLHSNGLTVFSSDIFDDLTSLKSLNLNSNNFVTLPGGLLTRNVQLEALRLNNNHIPLRTLPSGLFSNLTLLKELSLERCGIEWLPNDLFQGAVSLANMSLHSNNLKDLPIGLFSDLKHLERIYLSGNQLVTLNESVFNGLHSLKILRISHNKLNVIPSSLLYDLDSLEELDLRNNNLKELDPDTFVRNGKLRRVYLSHNQLSFAGSITDSLDSSSPLQSCTKLEVLELANNSIEGIFYDWRVSMINLHHLDLSNNFISHLDVNDLHYLSDKLTVDLRNNNISTIDLSKAEVLAVAQPESFGERSVKVFLDKNPLKCDCNVYHLLRYLEGRMATQVKRLVDLRIKELSCSYPVELVGRSLTSLDSRSLICDLGFPEFSMEDDENLYNESLFSNDTKQVQAHVGAKCPAQCRCFVRPEDRVLIVDCRGRNLPMLPRTLPVVERTYHTELLADGLGLLKLWTPFSLPLGYDRVKVLKLGRNSLTHIDSLSLPPHLLILELHYNNLTHLNKDVIAAISNASQISLHGNPWQCDCDARDLLKFVQERFKQVKFLPNVTCKSGYHDRKPLSQLTANDLCPLRTVVIVAACASVAIFGIALGTLAALYYRHQHAIKIWLYAHNFCLWLVTEDELDKDKQYDAFISYSHHDEDFVMAELVPGLEGGKSDKSSLTENGGVMYNSSEGKKDIPHFKLCLHYRDWVAGEWIPAQIARSVDASRRTIVVLSPAFLESIWGQMEFRAAHCRALSEGRTRVIVILYGDVPPTETLDSELRTYLTTNTYVKWGDPWFWQKLRYALPHIPTKLNKKAIPALAVTSDLDHKCMENGNGQCRQFELIHTNPVFPAEVTIKNG